MGTLSKNQYSHLTAKERDQPSFPTKWLFREGFTNGTVLDYGCGFGKDVEFLNNKGISTTGYDNYHFPKYPATEKFDVILCHYVFNVLLPEEQIKVMMDISELLKSGGRAYITVRRDVVFEGYRTHKIHKKPTYQCNVNLPFKSIFRNESCEIYEYQHFNFITSKVNCPFCSPLKTRPVISEIVTAYSFYDKYPVNKGHALIVPKRHTRNFFELSDVEKAELWVLTERVKNIIQREFNPDGFNMGFNFEPAGGQTVFHTHLHIIPRYKGDVINPRGGIRHVIPEKGVY